jgi:predicted transposase YbfD/YdcC
MVVITAYDIARMGDSLSDIDEPRRTSYGNIRHNLIDIIVIAFTSVLCGFDDFEEMEELGNQKLDFFKSFLELPNGIPDESTFRKVIERLDPVQLRKGLDEWLVKVKERQEERKDARLVNIDGKTIRGSHKGKRAGIDVVSAWIGEEDMVLGELVTEEKSNEIKAVPALLDLLDIKGDIITADAMSCQTEIVAKVKEKGADYIIAVKENQPTLYHDIKDYFDGLESGEISDIPADIWEGEEEHQHGRRERREVRVVTDIDWLDTRTAWSGLKSFIQYRTFRKEDGEEGEMKQTDQYYISSANFDADVFLRYIRGHWSIENRLHWCLDIWFREDDSRVRTAHGALNLNIMRKLALKRLRALRVPEKRFSGKRRMLRAVLNDDFLRKGLFGE